VDSAVQSAAGKLGALKRRRPDDRHAIEDAERDLKAARLEDYIRRTVADAPPLTETQRARLAALLTGGGAK